jgi:hypothetical protein
VVWAAGSTHFERTAHNAEVEGPRRIAQSPVENRARNTIDNVANTSLFSDIVNCVIDPF